MAPPYPPPQQGPYPPPAPGPAPQPAPVHPHGQPVESAERVVADVKSEVPKNLTEFERLPYPMMALVAGGFIAIGIGFLSLIVELVWRTSFLTYYGTFMAQVICAVLSFVADLVLGIGLLYCYVTAKRGNWYRAMWLGFVIGILLLIFGNGGGRFGGIVGIIGAILIFIDPNIRHLGDPNFVRPPPPQPVSPQPIYQQPPPAYGPPPPQSGYQQPPPPYGPPPPPGF
jgi:hypothetical protein